MSFQYDLKLFSRVDIRAKYGIDDESYDLAISKLSRGEEVPDLVPTSKGPNSPEQSPEPIAVEEDHFEVEISPASFGYKGTPFKNNILVNPVEHEHSSYLIIPENMKARSDIGYVKSVGPDVVGIKPGILVLYDKFASYGSDINLVDENGQERKFMLLKDVDIQLKLERVELDARNEITQ